MFIEYKISQKRSEGSSIRVLDDSNWFEETIVEEELDSKSEIEDELNAEEEVEDEIELDQT